MLTSVIRTYAPQAAALIIALLVSAGLDVDVEATTALIVSAIFAAYYAVARLIEHRWPAAGWLLGRPGEPTY
jgi:hypothetical protein